MTIPLRGLCQHCGRTVSTRWDGDVRVAVKHADRHEHCAGTGKAVRLPAGVLR